jgi:hypothetical protein
MPVWRPEPLNKDVEERSTTSLMYGKGLLRSSRELRRSRGHPDSVGDPTSRRSVQALLMVSKQLERDGKKVDEVEAVTLFMGDDGFIQRDVVLVVSKVQRRVVGVYRAWYGR